MFFLNKNKLFLLFLVSLACMSCGNSSDSPNGLAGKNDSFQISVNLKGVPDGYAKLVSTSDFKVVDSVLVKGQSFVFSGKLAYPQMMIVEAQPAGWTFNFFAENAKIAITGDSINASYIEASNTYDGKRIAQLTNYTVTGSESHTNYMKFQNESTFKQYDSIIKNFYDIAEKQKSINDQYLYRGKADSVYNISIEAKLQWLKSFIKENPSSVVAAYLLKDIYVYRESLPIGKIDSLLTGFSGAVTSSEYYKYVYNNLAKRKNLVPGKMAPDFTLLQRDSTPLTLSSLRGKYVMIDFWASWCHPCREAIPHWKKVYERYHSKGFEILSVSNDSNWAEWKKAMDIEKMPWLQVCDEFPVANTPSIVGSLYMTTYIPFYVLLDKEGKILVYSGSEKDIDDMLSKVLN